MNWRWMETDTETKWSSMYMGHPLTFGKWNSSVKVATSLSYVQTDNGRQSFCCVKI